MLKRFKWGRVGGVFTASGDKMSIIVISKKESEENWTKLKMEILGGFFRKVIKDTLAIYLYIL